MQLQIQISDKEGEQLLNVLATRPLGEVYALFESIRSQMLRQMQTTMQEVQSLRAVEPAAPQGS